MNLNSYQNPKQPRKPDRGQPTSPDRLLGSVVGRIRDGESSAITELHSVLYRGIRLLAQRQVGPIDAEDVAQETFLITIQAIQLGKIRNHDAIPGFVRTVAQRHVIRIIEERKCSRNELTDSYLDVVADPRSNPEQDAVAGERQAIMVSALRAMCTRDRMILTRFYLYGETKEQICSEMGLTETQFRLMKSRAKLSIEEKARSLRKPVSSTLLAQAAVA